MNKVINVKYLGDYTLQIGFSDGEFKRIDFRPFIGKGLSAALLDKAYFQLVAIDQGGGIEWPNGMDFCPNYLKEYVGEEKNLAKSMS